jgi:hypothetical protein
MMARDPSETVRNRPPAELKHARATAKTHTNAVTPNLREFARRKPLGRVSAGWLDALCLCSLRAHSRSGDEREQQRTRFDSAQLTRAPSRVGPTQRPGVARVFAVRGLFVAATRLATARARRALA